MTGITIEVPGVPVAKGRARFANGHAYTPKKTVQREARVAAIAHQEMQRRGLEPFQGAVELNICAVFDIPPSWPKWKRELALSGSLHHTTVPDRDNLEKAVKDGLNGIAWADDCQVVDGRTKKIYSKRATTWITVNELPGPHAGMKRRSDLETVA